MLKRSIKNDVVEFSKGFGLGIVKQWWILPLTYGVGVGGVIIYDIVQNIKSK